MVARKKDPKASMDCQAEKPGPTVAQNHRKWWERPWVKGNREKVMEGLDQGVEFFGASAGHVCKAAGAPGTHSCGQSVSFCG